VLSGPQFDLPLENISWQVYLHEKWQVTHWAGTMQLEEKDRLVEPIRVDVRSYLDNEVSLKLEKTKAAEEMLQMGNSLLEKGDPQQARNAFKSAYGLSTHDDAFNEDARVQLHNLKLQQALVGLNVRQSATAGDTNVAPGNLRDLRTRKNATYTQQEAKQVIESNSAEDNAALMRLAERLVQQQDAAVTAPNAIRATIPQQGRLLTFRRAVQVDIWTDLRIELETRASKAAPLSIRMMIIVGLFGTFALLVWLINRVKERALGV
jgi:hypothetical protein